MCCCPRSLGVVAVPGVILVLMFVYKVLLVVGAILVALFKALPYLLLFVAFLAFVSWVISPQGPEATPEATRKATPEADTDAVVEEAVTQAMRRFEQRLEARRIVA